MSRSGQIRVKGTGAVVAAAAVVLLSGLCACSSTPLLGGSPEPETPVNVAAPSIVPPPVDLAGRWQLSAAAGGACMMNFADTPGPGAAQSPAPQGAAAQGPVPQGTIAPGGGCPGSFFLSRKWTFENGLLHIHDFKGKPLAQMSYVGGHFEGQDASGSALTLSKQL
jgi:hypothetical protein